MPLESSALVILPVWAGPRVRHQTTARTRGTTIWIAVMSLVVRAKPNTTPTPTSTST